MNRKKRPSGIIIFALALFLISGALFAGFVLSGRIRNKTKDPEKNGTGINSSESAGSNVQNIFYREFASMTAEAICDFSPEKESIEEIIIAIYNTDLNRTYYLRLNPEAVYTMSPSLYRELTPANATLPQTVTFSEIYRYYGSDESFFACCRIVGEMLSINIRYYTIVPDLGFDRLSDIPGSIREFLEDADRGCITNRTGGEQSKYLEMLSDTGSGDISVITLPVIKMNESAILDRDKTAEILHDILY